MRARTRDRAMTLGFTALSFALAFWQMPGWATADTKIDLHVSPSRFLHSVASVWSPTGDLGEVHSAQYSGYLWPMDPFFVVLHGLGGSAWVVQRLWLGLMFAISVWGMLRLMDVLVGRPRGIAHWVAAGAYLLNPYIVVFTARTSITMLGYAALPWLLIYVQRGVRTRGWRAWWWAAAFALVFTSTGGGVNAAVVGWMLVGPAVMLLYEPLVRAVRWRDMWAWFAKMALLSTVASLWWLAPIVVHVKYGIDFLRFTERPETIWATNSITESLRLMGYWTSYIGSVGFGVSRPVYSDSGTLLFNPLVVGTSLILPALAFVFFVRLRRRHYATFFATLGVVALVIMTAGFPSGTPMRDAMVYIYDKIFIVRFMRTTNKAGPLLALSIAALLGMGAAMLWHRMRARPRVRALIPIVVVTLFVFDSLPLFQGQALDRQLLFKKIPVAWTQAAKGLDHDMPTNTRALVLPGSIFNYYTWGGTLDAILPRLTDKLVAVRYETPYSDLHADDLMITVDNLVAQRRLVPGQLKPMLGLMNVSSLVASTDLDLTRSAAPHPAASAVELAQQGFATPTHGYGPVMPLLPPEGSLQAPINEPQVRAYNMSVPRGIVHVDPASRATIVDGSAAGLAEMAAFGQLPTKAPILYAGDVTPSTIAAQAAGGGDIVVTDTNPRRIFLPQFLSLDEGPIFTTAEKVPTASALIDPFPANSPDDETVATLTGARYVSAPESFGYYQFPENGAIAAVTGSPGHDTGWSADRFIFSGTQTLSVGLNHPMDVPYVDIYPLTNSHGYVFEVAVNGHKAHTGIGWNRIYVHLHHVSTINVQILGVLSPPTAYGSFGGISQLRIPGVHIRPMLRPPLLVGRALAGHNISHASLTYLFQRTTDDDPFLRQRYGAAPSLGRPENRQDPEMQIDRLLTVPATRRYTLDAWVNPAIDGSDSAYDNLAGGLPPGVSFQSGDRFDNQPQYRASRAFDGNPNTAWIGEYINSPDIPSPWISWTSPHTLSFSHLRLVPTKFPIRRPTFVGLTWPGGVTSVIPVALNGDVNFGRTITGRSFKLTIIGAELPYGAPLRMRFVRAVGISELLVPGMGPVRQPQRTSFTSPCGEVKVMVGSQLVSMRVSGTVANLDQGTPLRAVACGPPVTMAAGTREVHVLPGPFAVDFLRMRSPAPVPLRPAVSGGTVVNPGKIGWSSVDGVRVALRAPSWLVLGESFDAGWQATCGGKSLGPPQAIDGFANGWLAPASCRRPNFVFAPQKGVQQSYLISAVACALMVVLMLASWRWVGTTALVTRRLPEAVSRGMSLPKAIVVSVALSLPMTLFFALRTGPPLFVVLTFLLWRGVRPRKIAAFAAGLLLIAVPATYAIIAPADYGGYDFPYAPRLIAAHWIGVGAVVLLGFALVRIIATANRASEAAFAEGSAEDEG